MCVCVCVCVCVCFFIERSKGNFLRKNQKSKKPPANCICKTMMPPVHRMSQYSVRTDRWMDRQSVAVYTVLKSMSSPVCCHGPSRAKTVFKHYLNIHNNSVKLLIPVSRIGDGHRHTIFKSQFIDIYNLIN